MNLRGKRLQYIGMVDSTRGSFLWRSLSTSSREIRVTPSLERGSSRESIAISISASRLRSVYNSIRFSDTLERGRGSLLVRFRTFYRVT